MVRRLIGTGTTDSNGQVVIEYTGTGAGRVQLTAEAGDLISDTYEILDATFLDKGVTGDKNNNWTNYSNRATITTDDTGTTVTGYASSNAYYICNADNAFTFTDYQCEFDVLEAAAGVRWYHQNEGGTNENIFTLNTYLTGSCHVKIIVTDGVATLYVDGVQRTTTNLTVDSPYEVAFRFTNGATNQIKYANFIIYPI